MTWGFMVYAGQPGDWAWFMFALPFAGWTAIPFCLLAVAVYLFRTTEAALRVLFASSILLTAGTAYVLYTGFVLYPDAQSGLILLFLPVWQGLGLLPLVIAAGVLHLRRRRARTAA